MQLKNNMAEYIEATVTGWLLLSNFCIANLLTLNKPLRGHPLLKECISNSYPLTLPIIYLFIPCISPVCSQDKFELEGQTVTTE